MLRNHAPTVPSPLDRCWGTGCDLRDTCERYLTLHGPKTLTARILTPDACNGGDLYVEHETD